MNKVKTIGLSLFFGGIILLIIYGLYLGFGEIIQNIDLITGFLVGIMIIGLIVLIISIFFEQRSNTKKVKEEIKKEDLEP